MIYSYTISGSARAALRENTAEPVKTTVVYYESYVRECRLAEIRGWRKALVLGAAGLAGLSPMKAQAHSPAFMFGGSEGGRVEQVVTDPEAAAKAAAERSGLSPDDQGDFEGGWLYSYRLNHGMDPHTGQKFDTGPSSEDQNQEEMEALDDAEAILNRAWQQLSPQQQAKLRADQRDWIKRKDKLPPDQRYSFIKNRVHYLQNFVSGDEQAQPAVTYSIKPGAVVTRRNEDLLKLKRLSAQGNKTAVRKFYRELISTKAAWEGEQGGDLNYKISVEPVGNGILKMQSPDGPAAYIAQDDLIPRSTEQPTAQPTPAATGTGAYAPGTRGSFSTFGQVGGVIPGPGGAPPSPSQRARQQAEPNTLKPTSPAIKNTKAYARGYEDGKRWAQENDIPDSGQGIQATKEYYRGIMFRQQFPPSGTPVTPYQIQSWQRYAWGWADAVFGGG